MQITLVKQTLLALEFNEVQTSYCKSPQTPGRPGEASTRVSFGYVSYAPASVQAFPVQRHFTSTSCTVRVRDHSPSVIMAVHHHSDGFFFILLLFVHFSCRLYSFSLSGCCLACLQSLREVGFLPAVAMCGSLLYLSALSAEAEMCRSLFSALLWNSRSLCY